MYKTDVYVKGGIGILHYFFGSVRIRVFSICALIAGITAGCFYCILMDRSGMSELSQYFVQYFNDAAKGVDGRFIFVSCVKQYAVVFAGMMVAGLFRAGVAVNFLLVARQGFSVGFTASAMLRVFGMRGIIASLYTMPEIIPAIPALLVLSVMCAKMALSDMEIKKKSKFFYFFWGFFMFTIFCASALLKSFFGTTFMMNFAGKI